MSIVLYFMRLEDKYWVLFLISLFFLWVIRKETAWAEQTVWYGVLCLVLFICPLSYTLFTKMDALSEYYQVSYIALFLPVIALAMTRGAILSRRNGIKKMLVYFAGCLVILAIAGHLAVGVKPDNAMISLTFSEDEKKAYDLILEDFEKRNMQALDVIDNADGGIIIYGPSDFMAKSRFYNEKFAPLYGLDIADEDNAILYSSEVRQMYKGYAFYESANAPLASREEQIGVLANFCNLYPDIRYDYLILYDPQKEGVEFDDLEMFKKMEYDFVGDAGNMQVLYVPHRQ